MNDWYIHADWTIRLSDPYSMVFRGGDWLLWPNLCPLVVSMWKDGRADYFDAISADGSDRDLVYIRSHDRAAHMLVRYYHRFAQFESWDVVFPRLVAFVGMAEDLAPFMTSTVVALLRPSRNHVHLPIVADALQDAGMPETHPLLSRCRDESVPFCRSEWVHRAAMKVRRKR